MNVLSVFVGGGFGALGRYLVSLCIGSSVFPCSTLFVNTVGSLIIGFLFSLFQTLTVSEGGRLFFITGFLGGFTTFSTYSLETARYILSGNMKYAVVNVLLNNILCMVFVIAGIYLGRFICRP